MSILASADYIFGGKGPTALNFETCVSYWGSWDIGKTPRVVMHFKSGEYETKCSVECAMVAEVSERIRDLGAISHLKVAPDIQSISIDVDNTNASISFSFPSKISAVLFDKWYTQAISPPSFEGEQPLKLSYISRHQEHRAAQVQRIFGAIFHLKYRVEAFEDLVLKANHPDFPVLDPVALAPERTLDQRIQYVREFVWKDQGCFEILPLSVGSTPLERQVEPDEFYSWINHPADESVEKRVENSAAAIKQWKEERTKELNALLDTASASKLLQPFINHKRDLS